jgi:kynurenine formamidase
VRGVDHHPNHRLLTHAGIPVLECLTNLVEIKKQRVFLIALPWPVVGLDACPVRAIAIEPEG